VEFRLLGPVEVRDGDRLVMVRTYKVRTLLVALLLQANRMVTVDELIDQLWGGRAPAHPRKAVQTNVRRLREALGDDAPGPIRTRPHGYLIELDPQQLDLLSFRRLVEQVQHAEDPVRMDGLMTRALALWRGEPLAGVSSESLVRDEIPRLTEEYLAAREQSIDIQLELGRHAKLVPELTASTRKHPLRERLWAQLMIALYRCGRQADALHAYQTLSRCLAVDPTHEVQRIHHAILVADPNLAA
jgi:DNA-binding SARP family transcriptional activator